MLVHVTSAQLLQASVDAMSSMDAAEAWQVEDQAREMLCQAGIQNPNATLSSLSGAGLQLCPPYVGPMKTVIALATGAHKTPTPTASYFPGPEPAQLDRMLCESQHAGAIATKLDWYLQPSRSGRYS